MGIPGKEVNIDAFVLESEEIIPICTTTIDQIGKFICQPESDLSPGIYYLYSNHIDEEEHEFTRIKVIALSDDEEGETSSKIQNISLGGSPKYGVSNAYLPRYLGENIFITYIKPKLEEIDTLLGPHKQVLVGHSSPGELILVTWQSFSLNSVLISDASQGAFETIVPKALESGEHRAYVYSYNTDSMLMRYLNKIIFSKT